MKKLKIKPTKKYSKYKNGMFIITCKNCVYKIYVEYNTLFSTVFFEIERTDKNSNVEYYFNKFAIHLLDILTLDLKKRYSIPNRERISFDSVFYNDLKKLRQMCLLIIDYFNLIKIGGI